MSPFSSPPPPPSNIHTHCLSVLPLSSLSLFSLSSLSLPPSVVCCFSPPSPVPCQTADPTEAHNLYADPAYVSVVAQLEARLKELGALAPPWAQAPEVCVFVCAHVYVYACHTESEGGAEGRRGRRGRLTQLISRILFLCFLCFDNA